MKAETLDRTVRRTHFERGYRPVVRQIAEWIKEEEFGCNCVAILLHCHIVLAKVRHLSYTWMSFARFVDKRNPCPLL